MTRITIKRPGNDVVIGSIVVNAGATLYDSKIATDAERADMERARNNIQTYRRYPTLVAQWLRSRGYTVEVKR